MSNKPEIKEVVRILIYRGPPAWIENTLVRSVVEGGGVYCCGTSSIRSVVVKTRWEKLLAQLLIWLIGRK